MTTKPYDPGTAHDYGWEAIQPVPKHAEDYMTERALADDAMDAWNAAIDKAMNEDGFTPEAVANIDRLEALMFEADAAANEAWAREDERKAALLAEIAEAERLAEAIAPQFAGQLRE